MRHDVLDRIALGSPAVPALTAALAAALTSVAAAGGSGERALVIADPSDPESLYVAHYYQAARDIPDANVLYMRPGAANFDAFRAVQARALEGTLVDRGLDAHVDYAILAPSDSFFVSAPGILVDNCSPVNRLAIASGYTLARRLDALALGSAVSVQNHYSTGGYQPDAFDAGTAWLQGAPTESPVGKHYLIGATLGWTGQNGNTLTEILTMIDRSVAADAAHPAGTFYFMETTDVARSGPRDFAFPAAVSQIVNAGGAAEHLLANLPLGEHDCLGVLTGLANPDIDGADLTLLPGAFADHLTSFAGTFDNNSQTKMSRWIAKGASGTCGTVEEPCNYSGKFPHARLHVEYFKGLTLGEAWFRSMGWEPFQNLLLGDPLTQPFAWPPTVDVTGLPVGSVSGTLAISPTVVATGPNASIAALELLVDGAFVETVGPGGTFQLDTTALADGWHELRVVASDDRPVENIGRWVGSIDVQNDGRTVSLASSPLSGDLSQRFDLTLAASGATVSEVRVLQNGRVVASTNAANDTVPVYGGLLGAGPAVRLVAEALFTDGTSARSEPLELDVQFAPGTPVGVPPIAYDYARTIAFNCEPVVVELPAAYDDAVAGATYTVTGSAAQATVLSPAGGPYLVLQPDEGATGADTLTFQVDTSGGSSSGTVSLTYLNGDCGPEPPVIAAVTPAAIPAVVVGTAHNVTLTGENFFGVLELSVDDQSLPFPSTFTIVDNQTITFPMPLVDTLGPISITIGGTHGTAAAVIDVVAPDPPVLELGDGGDPESLFSVQPIRLTGGGHPDTFQVLFASLNPAPSVIPGVWSLDMGGNNLELILVDAPLLGESGWFALSFFTNGLPFGTEVYFQMTEFDGTLPVVESNLATGLWFF